MGVMIAIPLDEEKTVHSIFYIRATGDLVNCC